MLEEGNVTLEVAVVVVAWAGNTPEDLFSVLITTLANEVDRALWSKACDDEERNRPDPFYRLIIVKR